MPCRKPCGGGRFACKAGCCRIASCFCGKCPGSFGLQLSFQIGKRADKNSRELSKGVASNKDATRAWFATPVSEELVPGFPGKQIEPEAFSFLH